MGLSSGTPYHRVLNHARNLPMQIPRSCQPRWGPPAIILPRWLRNSGIQKSTRPQNRPRIPLADVINAVGLLRGCTWYSTALSTWQECSQHLTKLGQAGPIIKLNGLDLKVLKDKSLLTRIRSSTAAEGVKIMVSITQGVWLVRIVQHIQPQVDHCIVGDGENRLILYSEESHPIRLCHESLSMCGGEKCPEIKIAEVLEIRTNL